MQGRHASSADTPVPCASCISMGHAFSSLLSTWWNDAREACLQCLLGRQSPWKWSTVCRVWVNSIISTPTPTPEVSTPTPTPANLQNINSNSNSGGFNSNFNSNSGKSSEYQLQLQFQLRRFQLQCQLQPPPQASRSEATYRVQYRSPSLQYSSWSPSFHRALDRGP